MILALAALLLFTWQPLWLLISTRTITHYVLVAENGRPPRPADAGPFHVVKGRMRVPRWSDRYPRLTDIDGTTVYYYLENGFRQGDCASRSEGNNIYVDWSYWAPEGALVSQGMFLSPGEVEVRESPPWFWDKQDQTEPSAPWWQLIKARREGDTQVAWYVDTGFKAYEFRYWVDSKSNTYQFRVTAWDENGRLREQFASVPFALQDKRTDYPLRTSPPWQWGATDQTEPSAPWRED